MLHGCFAVWLVLQLLSGPCHSLAWNPIDLNGNEIPGKDFSVATYLHSTEALIVSLNASINPFNASDTSAVPDATKFTFLFAHLYPNPDGDSEGLETQNTPGLTSSYDTALKTLLITGTGSSDTYTTILRTIRYFNRLSTNRTKGRRYVVFTLSDGVQNSSAVSVISVEDSLANTPCLEHPCANDGVCVDVQLSAPDSSDAGSGFGSGSGDGAGGIEFGFICFCTVNWTGTDCKIAKTVPSSTTLLTVAVSPTEIVPTQPLSPSITPPSGASTPPQSEIPSSISQITPAEIITSQPEPSTIGPTVTATAEISASLNNTISTPFETTPETITPADIITPGTEEAVTTADLSTIRGTDTLSTTFSLNFTTEVPQPTLATNNSAAGIIASSSGPNLYWLLFLTALICCLPFCLLLFLLCWRRRVWYVRVKEKKHESADAKTPKYVHPLVDQGCEFGYEVRKGNGEWIPGRRLHLIRGRQYTFQMVNVPRDFPFYITSSEIGGSNGIQEYFGGIRKRHVTGKEKLVWKIPYDCPSKLYYHCTKQKCVGWIIFVTNEGELPADEDEEEYWKPSTAPRPDLPPGTPDSTPPSSPSPPRIKLPPPPPPPPPPPQTPTSHLSSPLSPAAPQDHGLAYRAPPGYFAATNWANNQAALVGPALAPPYRPPPSYDIVLEHSATPVHIYELNEDANEENRTHL